MFRPLTTSHRRPPRRGTSFILIVVVMLSLFSAVGTAYALFAMREARLAMARKGEQGGGTGAPPRAPDPTDTINRFLSTLIYDTDDTDLTNALRGHGIARSMYGSMYGRDLLNPFNTAPWNGVGLFHEDATTYGYPGLTGDRVQFVNYTPMMIGGKPFLLDPEYMGTRPLDANGNLQPFNPAGRTYVSKAAGYSYPDLKDFFLAAYDPATGEVLSPSFHRGWPFGSLDPTNPNWTNATGRLFTLRPRPAEHPGFPRLPPNADATYTGDVQNLPGGVGPQRNDSVWIDMGLPVVTLSGNRKVKPLVAPLILPLNGLLNASAHGNTYYGGAHGSYHGFGPWEVNLGYVTPGAEANAIVNARGVRQQRAAINPNPPGWASARSFSPYPLSPTPVPLTSNDSAAAWNSTVVTVPAYPAGNNLSGIPAFVQASFQTNNAAEQYHPSLFNPTEWPGRGTQFPNRIFALSEAKRFNLRYADTRDWYSQSDLAAYAPTGLQGTFPFVLATGQTTQNSYRLDPAHANRGLITPTGYALDRPKVVPQYLDRAGNAALAIPAGAWKPANVSPGPYPSAPFNRSPVSDFPDFTNGTRLFNAWAALGSVNLNRPLADYRANTAQPLSAANLNTTAPNPNFPLLTYPDFDRRKLAHDIFVRLAVATGAAVTVNPAPVDYPQYQYAVQAAPTTPQYDALRYLAQLAANIVDYVDGDDVSTVFVWNPAAPNVDPNTDPNNFAPNQVANRVVFGVERPRLVINEVYGEIVNHPQELETKDLDGMGIPKQPRQPVGGSPAPAAHVRFWLELLNPTNTPANVTGPLGNGAATLWQTGAGGGFSPYQIEIARANRNNTSDATQKGQTWNAQTVSPTNTAGNWALNGGAFFKPDIAFQFTNAVPAVSPNNGQYSPGMARPANGFVLCGPPVTNPKTDEFSPAVDITSSPPQDNAVTPQNSLAYAMPLPTTTALISSAEYRQHVVLLRRLANPYQPPGPTNPFVTVDVMENVPAFDAVHRENSATRGNSRGQRNSNDGYDPPAERFSIGKVQPYAGQSVLAANFPNNNVGGYNQYQPFPASMVQRQQPNPANMGQPQHTLGRHNGRGNAAAANTFTAGTPPTLSDTLMTPFDWLPHMDRTLVNPLELLQVRDTPPFRVTQQFLVGAGSNPYAPPAGTAPGVGYDTGYPRWIEDGLARALEFLTVRPYTAGVPHGGRVPGQINVNAIPDVRVLSGLMDPQGGNVFDGNYILNPQNPQVGVWPQWMETRTRTQQVQWADQANRNQPVIYRTGPPTKTVFESNSFGGNGTSDRPFMPLGAPVAIPGSPLAYVAGTNADSNATVPSNVDLTILRRTSRGSPTQTVGNPPMLYALPSTNTYGVAAAKTTGNVPVYPASHLNGPSYFQAEPARKMLNNITTVNHQFVVFLTIGYFDVDPQATVTLAPGITVPQLGAEAYLNVPGDMRQKVIAVVDMSNMALDPVSNTPATVQPFFTSLEATAYGNGMATTATLTIAYSRYDGTSLYVAADGQEVQITAGTTLVIGYGVEQQVVQVAAIIPPSMTNPVPQVAVATMPVNGNPVPFRTAWGGTCVSNVRPGYPVPQANPSPQASFDYNSPTFKPVLPYFERLK